MYLVLTWYTLIMFLKVLSHLILKIKKSFMKYFKKAVLKYFKIFMKFLNISNWNISPCISSYLLYTVCADRTIGSLTYWTCCASAMELLFRTIRHTLLNTGLGVTRYVCLSVCLSVELPRFNVSSLSEEMISPVKHCSCEVPLRSLQLER